MSMMAYKQMDMFLLKHVDVGAYDHQSMRTKNYVNIKPCEPKSCDHLNKWTCEQMIILANGHVGK